MPPDYVFPFQHEAIDVLRQAMKANPRDARAPYYLGNLLFDWQPEEAMKLWEASAALDPSFAIVHRNLAIAYVAPEVRQSLDKAIASLEKAVSLERKYPLHFAELDELYEAAGVAPEKRLAAAREAISRRGRAARRRPEPRRSALKVALGKYDEAIRLMTGRRSPSGRAATSTWPSIGSDAHLLRGQQRLAAKRYREALADFQAAGKHPGQSAVGGNGRRRPRRRGRVWPGHGPRRAWRSGAGPAVLAESAAAMAESGRARRREAGGLSPQTAQLYYRALAIQKLGRSEGVEVAFRNLVESADRALKQASAADPSASFREQQNYRSSVATAHYIAALGHLGLNDKAKAKQELAQALRVSPDHAIAKAALAELN